ncbi:MAG: NAD-dependent epimerase/dehydratase family protein [Gammaproteobacteria bacterium]
MTNASPLAGKRIFMTGASGLVGSAVARGLAQQGAQLTLGLRKSSSLKWLQGVDFDRQPFRLDDASNYGQLVQGADIVLHCAAITRAAKDQDYLVMNTDASVELARLAAAAGVRRFVFVSSLAARGPDGGSGPDSPYGVSKLQAEDGIVAQGGDMEKILLRLGGVYGPRDSDLLSLFAIAKRTGFALLPPAHQILQPVYSDDAGAAIVAACAAAAPGLSGIPLDICEPGQYRWQQVAELFRAQMDGKLRVLHLPPAVFVTVARISDWFGRMRGVAPELDLRRGRDIAVNTWTCDASIAEQRIGWRAQTLLAEGLKQTLKWYQDQGWI